MSAMEMPAHDHAWRLGRAGCLRGIPVAQLSDALGRMDGTSLLRPLHGGGTALLGPAFTVRVAAGDNLLVHRALERLQPGEVLVVDGGGDCSRALVGEILLALARSRGCVGLVIDGAVRDSDAFARQDVPCYARGIALRGPFKNGPGSMGEPVVVGGMAVRPGDIVAGDADGLLTVAPEAAEAAAAAAGRVAQAEAAMLEAIAAGNYRGMYG